MNRLVCVVEGHGDVEALPALCMRVLHGHLRVRRWNVDRHGIKIPRSRLVDGRRPGPNRPCRADGVERALAIARSRAATAALFVCDSDDGCPAAWGRSILATERQDIRVGAVMIEREFESWLLHACAPEQLRRIGVRTVEGVRDAKERLRRIHPAYHPTTHQLELARGLDIARVESRSNSFAKLCRELRRLCGGGAGRKKRV